MMGIAGLPQGTNMPMGGRAPGQAMPMGAGQPPMPGMKPPAGGTPAGVASLVPNKRAQLEELIKRGMQPVQALAVGLQDNNTPPSLTMAAMSEIVKDLNTKKSVANQMAMQQARQQPQTVLQDLAQQAAQAGSPVMARHGGAMHSYRQGGIVGYQSGGATPYAVEEPEDITTLPLNERIRRTLARLRMGAQGTDERSVSERIREALPEISMPSMRRRPEEGPRQWQQATQGEEPDLMGETLIPFNEPDIGQAPNVAMLGKTGDPDVDIGPAQPRVAPPRTAPQAAPQAAPQVKPTAAPATTIDPILEARLKELSERGKVPADVQAGREGIASLVKAEMEARKRRMEQDQADALRRREEAIKSAPGVLDPEGLLRMASMIDPTRKGTAFRGISRGAAEVMAGQRAARQGAEKDYQEFQRLQRAEENLLSQMRTQEAVRLQALRERDVGTAQQAQDAVYAARMEFDKVRQARQDKQREIEIAEERNRIAREGVDVQRISATRPGAEIQLMEWLRSPENKRLYDSIQSAKRSEERLLKLRELYDKRPITAGEMSFEDFIIEFERATGKPSSTAGGPPPGAVRLKGQQ